jgi:hypothetical protein
MPYNHLVFRVHAIQRMFQRRISEEDIRQVLAMGNIIESYPDDTPYRSFLVLHFCGSRAIHVVAADNHES